MARKVGNQGSKALVPRTPDGHLLPDTIEAIMDDWLRGTTISELSRTYGVDRKNVGALIERHRPGLNDRMGRNANELLAEAALIRREAWKMYHSSSEPLTPQALTAILEMARPNGTKVPQLKIIEKLLSRLVAKTQGDPTWLHLVQTSLEFEARVRGYYAPARLEIEGEFRVAGIAPEDLDREMMEKFAEAAARYIQENPVIEGKSHGQKAIVAKG